MGPRTQWEVSHERAQRADHPVAKMSTIVMSAIKLRRTDTTLDLSHRGKESWRGKRGRGGRKGERAGFIYSWALNSAAHADGYSPLSYMELEG